MKVIVKASAVLKEWIGEDEVTLDLAQGSTVRDAMKLLSERYGKAIENFVLTKMGEMDDEVLSSHSGVLVESADAQLSDGDLVLLIPYIGGG